jgi:hypothetical protein
MTLDDVDRLFSDYREITPSPMFLGRVMDSVRREAQALPPLAFPWKWALPGLVGAAIAAFLFVGVTVQLIAKGAADGQVTLSMPSGLIGILDAARAGGAGWVATGIIVSFVSASVATRIVKHFQAITNNIPD